ncbi:hypothetical protein PH7735_02559 [Shimia thalassica]|uniref:Uncharacterized protein n=1 Tax=Shimia thalassica TaxID=1715693 RepID=A0A0P1ISD7_9RHOB|nr:hypothetical protein PH7735_02559 [Shimia thalassica]
MRHSRPILQSFDGVTQMKPDTLIPLWASVFVGHPPHIAKGILRSKELDIRPLFQDPKRSLNVYGSGDGNQGH